MAEAYTYRGHLITPIDGETTWGQSKVRISGPIVNEVKAAENARLAINDRVNRAEREAILSGAPPVISEDSRCMALYDWAKRRRTGDGDEAIRAAYHAMVAQR